MTRQGAVAARENSTRPRLAVVADEAAEQSAAVIDLGSNSWRVVAYRYLPRGAWRRIAQLQAPVRIAAGL